VNRVTREPTSRGAYPGIFALRHPAAHGQPATEPLARRGRESVFSRVNLPSARFAVHHHVDVLEDGCWTLEANHGVPRAFLRPGVAYHEKILATEYAAVMLLDPGSEHPRAVSLALLDEVAGPPE
jgi:hypothetical protein